MGNCVTHVRTEKSNKSLRFFICSLALGSQGAQHVDKQPVFYGVNTGFQAFQRVVRMNWDGFFRQQSVKDGALVGGDDEQALGVQGVNVAHFPGLLEAG